MKKENVMLQIICTGLGGGIQPGFHIFSTAAQQSEIQQVQHVPPPWYTRVALGRNLLNFCLLFKTSVRGRKNVFKRWSSPLGAESSGQGFPVGRLLGRALALSSQ